jgi:hypothetical protein
MYVPRKRRGGGQEEGGKKKFCIGKGGGQEEGGKKKGARRNFELVFGSCSFSMRWIPSPFPWKDEKKKNEK